MLSPPELGNTSAHQLQQMKIPDLLKLVSGTEGTGASFSDLGYAHFKMSEKLLITEASKKADKKNSSLISDENCMAFGYLNLGVKQLDYGRLR